MINFSVLRGCSVKKKNLTQWAPSSKKKQTATLVYIFQRYIKTSQRRQSVFFLLLLFHRREGMWTLYLPSIPGCITAHCRLPRFDLPGVYNRRLGRARATLFFLKPPPPHTHTHTDTHSVWKRWQTLPFALCVSLLVSVCCWPDCRQLHVSTLSDNSGAGTCFWSGG